MVTGVTSPPRTVADCARWLPFDEALAVADSAMRAGLTRRDLLAAVEALPRTGRERARWVVRFEWDEVMHHPAYVAAVLADVVRWATPQAVRRECEGGAA